MIHGLMLDRVGKRIFSEQHTFEDLRPSELFHSYRGSEDYVRTKFEDYVTSCELYLRNFE